MNSKIKTKFLSIAVLIVLFTGKCFSQENVIHKLTDSDHNVAVENHTSQRSSSSIEELPYDLLFDLNSTIYIKDNGILNIEGVSAPVALKFLDTKSFNFISTRDKRFSKVELITVNLDSEKDLTTPFNLGAIRGFDSLKYIHLKCEFPISENQIRAYLKNADPEIIIFYNTYKRS